MDILTAIILIIFVIVSFWIGLKFGAYKKHKEWEEALPDHRQDAIMKSRAVLGGHFSENLAPFLPNFPFLPNECRFIGKPIDFIVFKGMDEKQIEEVVFVEVKSGKASLSQQEKNLKETIKNKRVRWEEYRIPEELTQKGNIEEKIQEIVKQKSM